ncbi:MAG: type II toxin-antitoxin system HicB family antitoxin [Deinococcales bacterium]
MNTISYKGYTAQVGYSDEDQCFVGHLAAIQDIVGFHGTSVLELRQAFEEAVDDYLETCAKLDRLPQGYSPDLVIWLSEEVHEAVAFSLKPP